MRFHVPFRRPGAVGRLTPLRVLILLAWSAVFVPRTLQSLTSPKFRVGVGEGLPYTTLASLADRGLQLLLILWCAGVVLSRARRLPDTNLAALAVMLLPWLYLTSRDMLLQSFPKPSTVVYGVVVVAVWVLQPRLEALRDVAILTVLGAGLSLVLAIILPSQGLFTDSGGDAIVPEKALLPFGILVGPFTSGNNLGQVLAAGVTMVALLPRRWRVPAALLVASALVWTSSRSSLIAVTVAFLVALACAAVAPAVRSGLAALAGVLALTVMTVTPLVTRDDLAFTNRGFIWRGSLDAWAEDPAFGLGSSWYSRVGGSSEEITATAFHGHNELVQMLVTGGWIMAGLVLLLLLQAIVVAARWAGRGAYHPLALVLVLLVTSTFEVSLGFVDRAFLVPVVALPLAIVLLSPQSRPDPRVVAEARRPMELTSVPQGWR